ncbi:MAG TPA: SDR family oxidoreductase [Micromonosporaceae bacterium]|nr:SDR family oxidoreductase [Micromonosporaceae bacterium]
MTAIDLTGRRALVVGTAHDAVRACALSLAAAGATVVAAIDGTADDLERELKEAGGDHRLVCADVTRPDGVDVVLEACHGAVDIVVTAGPTPGSTPLAELTPDVWRRALDSTLTAAVLVVRGVRPRLAAEASIVHIGSTLGSRGEAGASAGAAAAAGLVGLTRSLAKELGPDGVRVNLVAAGPAVAAEHVAAVVLFLASERARGASGETFIVDGGE